MCLYQFTTACLKCVFALLMGVLLLPPAGQSQVYISGSNCVMPGSYYGPYTIYGLNWSAADKWCVDGGTINVTGSSCINNNGNPSIGIAWGYGTTGTVSYYSPATAATPIATYTVNIINVGNIQPAAAFVPTGIPATVTFTSPAPTGCGSGYTYQWLVSTDNGTNYSSIPGATGSTYTFTNTWTSNNYRYRTLVYSNSPAGSSYTIPAIVIPSTPINPGTLSPSSATINYNTSPGTLTATASSGGSYCSGNYTYTWQQSTNNTNWTTISGAGGLSYTPGNLTTTTYFRQAVTCGPLTQYTNTATITVYPPLQGGNINPATQSLNYNATPGQLSLAGVSGGNGSYTYQWQQSTDNSNWSNIGGATGTTYSPVNTPGAVYYRVIVTSIGINAVSGTATVSVMPPLTGGSVSGNTGPLVYNTSPGTFNSAQDAGGGNCGGSYNYQWQQSTNNTSWSDISGATGNTYFSGNLAQPTYFRRRVVCGSETAWSNTLAVQVSPQLLPGAVTPDKLTIPSGTSPGMITASSSTGGVCGGSYSYQWQQSADGSSWSDIGGATGQNYTPGALNATIIYRRRTICGGETVYTNTSTIVVSSSVACDLNYIRDRVFTQPGLLNKAAADAVTDPRSVKQNTQYFDGLGRLVQTVTRRANPQLKDMVAPVVYDAFGREATRYLPYVAEATDGNYRCNPIPEQTNFIATQFTGEQFSYGSVDFEPSPLNRINQVSEAGNSWSGSNRGVGTKYWINTADDDVKMWNVTDVAGGWGSYAVGGNYAAGELYKIVTVNEQGKQVIEFKDKEGRVLLKKVQLTAAPDDEYGTGYTGWLCTYYIFDDFGRLRAALPPKAVDGLKDHSWDINYDPAILTELCFRYEYDPRSHMIMKKVPGAGEVYIVYDARDRMAMTQDANMRVQDQWLVMQYENALNRPVQTGRVSNSAIGSKTFAQHLSDAAALAVYPFSTPPASGWELLTVTHYDDYNGLPPGLGSSLNAAYINGNNFITSYNSSPAYAQPITQSQQTTGLPTWTQTKVLGAASQYTASVNMYDEKGRVIQVQSVNQSNGLDITTTQYDFAGQVLRTHLREQNAEGTVQNYEVLSGNSFDEAGRLTKTEKNFNNAGLKTTATLAYDVTGRLKTKVLSPDYNGGAGLQTLGYDYNIRGWLLGMNRNFLATEGQTSDGVYFGFELGYDKTANTAGQAFGIGQFNGNIAGMLWKSRGDNTRRKYDFTYDAANRLLKGDFTQQNPDDHLWNNGKVNYNVKMGDGIDPLLAYDANGNIRRMQQWGLKVGGSTPIDDLNYTYLANSNKLQSVTDAITTDNKLGDFTDRNTSGADYGYDKNGNMVTDLNKRINGSTGLDITSGGAITYNHLNLPQQVVVKDNNGNPKGTVSYVYDASGKKLQKITFETGAPVAYNNASYTSDITTTTTYSDGFVYESKSYSNGTLSSLQYTAKIQFLAQEEGRIRALYANTATPNTATGFAYDYFLKDHLGNVRMVLTEEQQTDIYPAATLEGDLANSTTAAGYESQFYTINSTGIVPKAQATGIPDYVNNNGISNPYPSGNSGNTNVNSNSLKLYKLNSSSAKTGLGITLKVMGGDKIDIFGKSYYFTNNTGGAPVNAAVPVLEILTGLLGAPGGTVAANSHEAVTATQLNALTATTDGIVALLGNQTADNNNNTSIPKAYINYIFFDEQFKYAGGSFSKAGSNSLLKDHHSELQNISVPKNGYVYIYCSNESPVDVFFDNLQVVQTRGPILEETHYYPFGLTMAGISSKAVSFGNPENKRKFNEGSELQHKEFSDGSGLELYETSFRSIDPQLGRFWQVDPMAFLTSECSPYAFALNNPVLRNDPTGLKDTAILPAVTVVGHVKKLQGGRYDGQNYFRIKKYYELYYKLNKEIITNHEATHELKEDAESTEHVAEMLKIGGEAGGAGAGLTIEVIKKLLEGKVPLSPAVLVAAQVYLEGLKLGMLGKDLTKVVNAYSNLHSKSYYDNPAPAKGIFVITSEMSVQNAGFGLSNVTVISTYYDITTKQYLGETQIMR